MEHAIPIPMAIRDRLEQARRELLDLSTRNRLLAVPLASRTARVVEIVDERAGEVFRLLSAERKALSFTPAPEPSKSTRIQAPPDLPRPQADSPEPEDTAPEDTALPPADDVCDPSTGLPRRHVDARLQTQLTPEHLQRRLLDLYRDAQTTVEETGVNVLYLAIGQLKWFDVDDDANPRHAPLVLVPVQLDRRTASERFVLRAREEDIEENLSLQSKLETDLAIRLPEFPDVENLDLPRYFSEVCTAVASHATWEVLPDAMVLGCFSFAKLLMYRDLDPDTWPAERPLLGNPLLPALLVDGFAASDPLLPESTALDELIPVQKLDHVVDADGSQTLAIEMVRQGRNLVLQGPPGTGKSQSITNIIATAVLDGRKVLFVAEKLAALEVVKRRLEREGLGDLCLELHSHKAAKRAVLNEIGRTWRLGKPRNDELDEIVPGLTARRTTLNNHCTALHTTHAATGLTPFRVLGECVRLENRGESGATIDLPDAATWPTAERSRRESLVANLAACVQRTGLPAQNPWRGVGLDAVLPSDTDRVLARAAEASRLLETCRIQARDLARTLGKAEPACLAEVRNLRGMARHAAAAPTFDRTSISNPLWDNDPGAIRDLVAVGHRYRAATETLDLKVTDAAWEKDFEAVRSSIAAHGPSLFRFLNGEYRRALAELKGVAKGTIPSAFEERLALVDELVAGQRALRALRAASDVGNAAFGSAWRAERTDWARCSAVADWIDAQRADGLDATFRQAIAALPDPRALGPAGDDLERALGPVSSALHELTTALQLDLAAAFGPGVEHLENIPLQPFADRLTAWHEQPEALSLWTRYHGCDQEGRQLGLGPLLDGVRDGTVPQAEIVDAFRRACFNQILREMMRSNPQLARFDGAGHAQIVEEFRGLDRERLRLSRYRVLAAHHARMPGISAGVGAVGIVNGELERKRGHRPVRQLLRDAGSVVQSIKPVFMMSPLSVAQFLAPGAVEFDLLVIDEASQVQPVDALGAIARCRQIVVVGDSRQLPPTRFFARVTGDDSETTKESGAARVQDLESILGLCSARGLPGTMLRWHYRSRHHSLIAVSNREFYENRLFIVPSPREVGPDLGLQFQLVPEGVFDSGGTGTNRIEAKAVCRAVLEHARQFPALSLGVAAFSVRQQQAILDELELLRREHPDTEAFFAGHPEEPFFVKNLETVQGDERDVILISIGYGRDADGFLRMNFGPLGADGGERRLNVLISRARRRCVAFSSIQAADIDLSRAGGRGVAALKTFLQFAETGRLEVAEASSRQPQSPFEESVRDALQTHGHSIHPQVGIAGFFIDLGVVDPDQPGRYLLGIECDGATYHASRSARDRDRLRQAVLEDHGWRIHRIWSTDWFQRPAEQLRQTLAVIEDARRTRPAPRPQESPQATSPTRAEIERADPAGIDDSRPAFAAEPYQVADFAPPRGAEPAALPTGAMTDLLQRIIEVEGPVHEDELVARVRDLWALPRAGARVQDAVARGVRALLVARRCVREDDCLDLPDRPVRVRSRDGVRSANLRKPDFLPPSEIRAAILAIAAAVHGVNRAELPTAVARVLGFKTTPASLRVLVERQCSRLETDGLLTGQNGFLLPGQV